MNRWPPTTHLPVDRVIRNRIMAVRWWWACLLIGVTLTASFAADQGTTAVPTDQDDPPKPAVIPVAGQDTTKDGRKPPPLDLLKSAGAIFVLYEEAKETLRMLPKAIVLTPEKYQELLDQLEQLRKQVKPERPQTPSVCKLSGRVDGNLIRIKAVFEFKTDRPRASVALACRRGWAVAAALDAGELPAFQPLGEDGYVVVVEQPGTHQVSLDLALPMLARGAERSFELDLPRAAITVLDQFEFPGDAADIRVAGRAVAVRPAGSPVKVEALPLGPVDRLDVSWKGPAATKTKVPTTLTARGRIVARVEDALVRTEAELHLQVLSGAAQTWRIQIPPGVTLEKWQILPGLSTVPPEKAAGQDERVEKITPATEQEPVLTITLREPSAEPLRVILHGRQPRKGTTIPIGPYAVQDVRPQQGTIEVRGRSDLRLRPILRGEVVQREVTEDLRVLGTLAAFTYWDLLAASNPRSPGPAPLTLDLDAAKGSVETRAIADLRLLPADGETPPSWRVHLRFDFTPARTSVDRLELELPPGFQFDQLAGVMPAQTVENPVEIKDGPGTRRTMVMSLAQRLTQAFSVDFSGTMPITAGRLEAAFELPRLTQVIGGVQGAGVPFLDRGGRVQVTLPPGWELLPRVLPPLATPARGTEPLGWPTERMPAQVELAWQARRADAPSRITAEVVIAGRRVRVRQQFQFARAPRQLRLRVPPGISGPIRLANGGELVPDSAPMPDGNGWVGVLGPVRDEVVTLTYSFPLPELPASGEEGAQAVIPLLQSEAGGDARVFVWADPEWRPSLAGTGWEELPLELGPDPERLPDLVLRGHPETRLALRLRRAAAAPRLTAVVDRALVRVTLTDAGPHVYHVRYLLSRLNARHLDIELPSSLARAALGIRLDGKEVRRSLVDETGREVEVGRLVRLEVEPELVRKPVLLEITFALGGSRGEGNSMWQSRLRPPVLVGAALLGPTRWGIELSPGWLTFHATGASVEQRWGVHGWLPAPRPAATSDELESWLAGTDPSTLAEDSEPGLVCRQSALGPITLVHVPRQAWLLACSLTFLAIGLGLSFVPLPRGLFWTIVAGLGVLIAAVSVLWPNTLALLVYGCQPAALVLLVVVCAQWTLQQRYRRRLVFLPSFTRAQPGSSLIRSTSSSLKAPLREPSTIDQLPAPRGSSVTGEV